MSIKYKAYIDDSGELVWAKEGEYLDLNIGLVEVTGLFMQTDNTGTIQETPPAFHTHIAAEITDFDTEVANNTAVVANTAKRTYPAVDEAKLATIEPSAKDDQDADEVPLDNTGTNLAATDVEAAIKELDTRTTASGALDHGNLGGLSDDDHIIYHTDARGDARYFTKTELVGGQLDFRYYTEAEVTTFLNGKEDKSQKGIANGYAPLDGNSKIPTAFLPPVAIGETFVVADITARDALPIGLAVGQVSSGDVVIVTDASADPGVNLGGATYRYTGSAYARLLQPESPVQSVNGQTGIVNLTTSDVPEGTNLYYTDVRVVVNPAVQANTTHRGITSGNPHGTDLADVVAVTPGTDVNASELETLTDGSDVGSLHNHDSRYYTQGQVNSQLSLKVTGPLSSVNNRIPLFDGTNGRVIKDSGRSFTDSSDLSLAPATDVPSRAAVKSYVDNDHRVVITQAGHGLTLIAGRPLPIRYNGVTSSWVRAQANATTTVHSAFATEIIDNNTFVLQCRGIINVPGHGLTVGQYYYLSSSVAGNIISLPPLTTIDDPVYFIIDPNHINMLDNRAINRESLEKFLYSARNTAGNNSVNINTLAFTAVPFSDVVVNEAGYYTGNSTFVTINKTRSYRIYVNLHYRSAGQRTSLQGQLHVNGNPIGPIASTGYIRNQQQHQEASLHIATALPLNANDQLSFRVKRESTVATSANMAAIGTSTFEIEAR